MAPTKYFVKVPQVGRFMPLVGGFRRPVESPLITLHSKAFYILHPVIN